jgi:hypothetical protein
MGFLVLFEAFVWVASTILIIYQGYPTASDDATSMVFLVI